PVHCTQDDDLLAPVQCRQALQDPAATARRIGPNPGQEFPADPLGTAGGQLRPHAPEVPQLASEHAPQADDAGYIKKDDGVAGLEPQVERPTVVAIHDPCFAACDLLDLRPPLLLGRGLPAPPPVEPIEMDQGQAGALGEPPRECALPRPARADDQDALHGLEDEAAVSRTPAAALVDDLEAGFPHAS